MSTPEFNPNDQRTKINPEDLPPLEPTAEVPAVHSDKLNNPAYWSEKFEGKTAVVPKEHRDDRHKEKTGFGWKKPAAAMALVAATAAGVFGGAKALGGDTNTEPRQEPSASAPANPGETKETQDPNDEISDFAPVALTVENYQDGDQLIRAWNSERNKWVMSGVDMEEEVDWADPEASIAGIAADYDTEYIETLLVDDWQERPQLYDMVVSYIDQHRIVLNASIMTTDSTQPEDIEPYEEGQDVTMTRIEESTPDQMVVTYRYSRWSNADQNRGDLFIENVNGKEGGETVTFVNQDGVWKISDIKYFAG